MEAFRAGRGEIVAVLLDMTMPHMGGEETFRALRRIDAAIPVIVMSGYTEEDIVGRFAGKGLAGFLHKPFSPASVQAKLRDVLQRAPEDG